MKSILNFFLILSLLFYPILSNATGLSNEEAKNIIKKELIIPK